MKGLLATKGLQVSEKIVGASLQRVCCRGQYINGFNPVRYAANYFGHKIHMDQNEKLIAFGVTHVLAHDGYSGMIVGYMSLPVKNNVAIYEAVFR